MWRRASGVAREAFGARAVVVLLLQAAAVSVGGALVNAATSLPALSLVLLCLGVFFIIAAVSLVWLYGHPDWMRVGRQRSEARVMPASAGVVPGASVGPTTIAPTAPLRDSQLGSAPSSDGVSGAARDALLREYRAGEQLVAGNQQSPITARVSAASRMLMPPMTTAAAVEQWEKRVEHLLHRAERWELADYFLADVPAPPAPTVEERLASSRAMSAVASMKVDGPWNPELGRRLDFRLAQLNTVIKRKL